MNTEFFNTIPKIKLKDELSLFLGSIQDGIVEFSYLDIVKSAGHSCPTVAGAYLCTIYALNHLYDNNELAKRGEIMVSFKDDLNHGATGVISNVISQITGATEHTGFKGLNGNYVRHSLINYNANIQCQIRFTRIDTAEQVCINYNPSSILADPKIQNLMEKNIQNTASNDEKELFAQLWQERVKNIFKNSSDVIEIKG